MDGKDGGDIFGLRVRAGEQSSAFFSPLSRVCQNVNVIFFFP